MQEDFLKKFIEEERYLQNPPLRTKDFIDFCKKRGIETDEHELEFFEKEGLLYPILRVENPKNSIGNHNYITILFQDFEKDLTRQLFKENKIIDPSKVDFKPYSTFKDKELKFGNERVSNYYSSFQIHWLLILKESYSFKVDLIGDKHSVYSYLTRLNGFKASDAFSINNFNDFKEGLEKESNIGLGKFLFNFEKKKGILKNDYVIFERFLEFFLSIQEYYYPFGKSASRTIIIKQNSNPNSVDWWEKRLNFDPQKELETLNEDIKEVSFFYWLFSKRSMDILGVERDDWIQLWKNLAWNEKDELKGDIRLGIEYLQWALMLKKFMEDYCEKEILDVDEIRSIAPEDIIKVDPFNMDKFGLVSRRFMRNKSFEYPQRKENPYHNKYKRLFYLANDFGLNYHPRLIVFVEGGTELKILPRFFEFLGSSPENLGIDFVDIGGINQFFGKEFSVKNGWNKYDKMILSNFTNLINYTLNKWQILPFFVGDNENNIKKLLTNGLSIKLDGGDPKTLPHKWYHIWDKDFELDNFDDEEIATAINEVLNTEITNKDVEKIRKTELCNKSGINKIDKRVDDPKNKLEISNVLFENLIDKYNETEDETLLDKPIFKLIEKLKTLAWGNHPPTDNVIEVKNKEYLSYVLDEKEKYFDR